MTLLGENLTKIYSKRKVVDDVTIEVKQGEIVGLLGPNGAGKTTIFHMMTGLCSPTGGRIFLEGDDITDLPLQKRAKMGITYLPQEPSIFRRLTAGENIMAVAEFSIPSKKERGEKYKELLKEFDLLRVENTLGYQLSGGERRRVEIARALVLSPKYVLLDEPFSGIDPILVADLQNYIKELRDKNIGILLSDHNVREALKICDRVYIINEGRVIFYGLPEKAKEDVKVKRFYLGKEFTL